jgi:HEAT repeat protein
MSSVWRRGPGSAEPPAAGRKKVGRLQVGVRGLIVAVACFGVITWAARSLWEDRHPSVAAARGLEARKPSDRARATRELMSTGVDDPGPAAPPLIAALGDPAAEVRAGAAEALGVIAGHVIQNGPPGDVPRTATMALIRSVEDPDPAVRIAAMYALQRIASTPGAAGSIDLRTVGAAFVETLGDPDDELRLLALNLLARYGTLRPAEPPTALGTALEDRSAKVRAAAIRALSSFACPLDPWLPFLLRGLERDEPEVRFAYLTTFARMQPPAFSADAIPALVAALASRARTVRFSAASALEPYAREPRVGAALIPALLALLRDPIGSDAGDPAHWWAHMTRQAAEMLGRIAPGTESAGEAVAALAEAVRSGDYTRRQSALEALVAFGPAAEPAIPALILALRGIPVGNDVRSTFEGSLIARTLTKIAPGTKSAGEVIAALTEVVRSDDPTRRAWAADALGEFGRAAEPAIPALVQALREILVGNDERSTFEGSLITRTLTKIAPGTASAGEVVAALTEVVRSGHPSRRLGAIWALGEFGSAAEPVVPVLIRALREDLSRKDQGHDFGGQAAARALGRITPGTKSAGETLEALIEAVDSCSEGHVGTRLVAIEALPAFGAGAARALPRLRDLRKDPSPRLRAAADRAVTAIEGAASGTASEPEPITGAARRETP